LERYFRPLARRKTPRDPAPPLAPWPARGFRPNHANASWLPDFTLRSSRTRFSAHTGNYGGIALDGLNVALAVHTPGPMADGNWSVAAYIDERADDKQTEALGAIFTGAAGGPIAALAPLIGKKLGVTKVPITYRIEGKRRSAEIPGILCTCQLIRCRPRIRAGRCGQIPAIRSASKSDVVDVRSIF